MDFLSSRTKKLCSRCTEVAVSRGSTSLRVLIFFVVLVYRQCCHTSFATKQSCRQKITLVMLAVPVLLRKLDVWPFKFMDLTTHDFKRQLITAIQRQRKSFSLILIRCALFLNIGVTR